ncbi:MAG: riboflavin synthase, partial [Acidobacteria bacterium]|nr:riboflavin synthase [Acidobacteriota bacterium]
MLSVVVPRDLTPYIVAKGSLAIEGISLTVAAILGTRVNVAIIPHTAAATNLGSLQAGDAVNLEVDVLAKYIEKMMNAQRTPGSLSLKHLKQQGF